MKAPLDRDAPQPDQPVRRRLAPVRAVKIPETDEQPVLPPPGSVRRMTPQVVSRLQAAAGNAAVSRLMVQRRQGPESDPKFRALTKDIRAKQKRLRAHPPARSEAAKAQGAAKAPPDDKQARGKAAQAEKMNAAKPGEFDKAAFIKAVNAAIDKQAPKSLSEAKDFGSSGKAAAIKGEVSGRVTSGKQASAGPIDAATKAAPDTSKVEVKAVTPLAPDHPPSTPATPDPALAIPDKAPKEATDFSEGPKQVDNEMAEAGVTETQLAESNEPEFGGALEAKKEGEEHSATAPAKLRASEAQTLAATKGQAVTAGAAAMGSMAATRKAVGTAVTGGKQGTKATEETKRAQVAAILQKVFDATKKDVEGILKGLDKKVDDAFNNGEKAARDAFTAEHKQKMEEYKDRRYSGLRGKYRWVRDKFKGLPSEANQIFVNARAGYVSRMQQVIASVAEVISVELGRAKARIAQGRNELKAEVDKLPKDLKALGKKAAGEFGDKFDQLTESVDSKGNELVQTLATKYKNALTKVDEEIEEEKEKNSGLIARAINAVKAVIKTILELKDLLFNVLAKAAEAIGSIIAHPIRFLGNLVSAVGAGLEGFMSRIGEHLKKGLVSWLLGTAGSMGIEIPKKFDLPGIVMMIAGMLGLTWGAIKARVISRGIPGKVIEMAEGSLPIIAKLRSDGIGALGDMIVEKVGDLKEMLFTKIGEYLIPEVLKAGVMFIISMLNPASAFIKACKMIIDIVMFIFTRGKQIIEFINAVLDAVIAIAKGGTGGVPAMIENALAKSIPVLIGVLAAILGVGGIADKVKKFIQSLSKPVMKAVDWVTDKIVSVGRGIWGRMKSAAGRIKDKITGKKKDATEPTRAAGKAVKGRAEADLAGRMGGSISSAAQVKSAIGAVYAKYQPQGVTGIRVSQTDVSHYSFDVVARKIDERNPTPEKFMNKDFQVRLDSIGKATGIPHTALVASWNGAALPRMEQDHSDHHAEDAMAAYILEHRDSLPGPGRGRRNRLDVTLTKSPCPRCGRRLARFASDNNVQLSLAVIGLYRGKRGTVEEKEASFDALVKLEVKGVDLRVPTVREVLAQLGNPRLTKESLRILKQKLANMREILKDVNAEAAAIRKAGR